MAFSQSRQDSSGTLKTTISLGRTGPSIVHSGPFYLMKELPKSSELTGATNLLNHHKLGNSFLKLSVKKKNELSAFLHNVTDVDFTPTRPEAVAGSTLMSLIESRITIKDIVPLTTTQMVGFRLHPGQLPAQYRISTQKTHKKHKKHKKKQRSQREDSSVAGEGFANSEVITDQAVSDKKKKEKKKEKRKKKHKKDQSPQ